MARRYAAADPRVTVLVNERRLGMLGNTRRALTLPHALHPGAQYTALASDHDVWEPGWLASLVAALDAAPDAVLAYPLSRRIDADGRPFARTKPPWRFDTAGIRDPRERLRRAYAGMVAGDMIYGLFRRAPLERVGAYRAVLVPGPPAARRAGPARRVRAGAASCSGRAASAASPSSSASGARSGRTARRGTRAACRGGSCTWPCSPATTPSAARAAALGLGRGDGAALAVTYLGVALRHRAWRRWARARKRLLRLVRRAHPRRLAGRRSTRRAPAPVSPCAGRGPRAAAERAVARGAGATGRRARAQDKLAQLLADTADGE